MATVVLTAVGSLIGGPIGGMIGAALGQQIDRAVLGGGKGREGPRLKELDIQTSSYGTQIPAIFGAMRVAGTVIWSTDLIGQRVNGGGGKGKPSAIDYSYSASFAVALSSRPVARIGRIWADGNLLRGAAGDFKTETEFRFHDGQADQSLDPLLASAEAMGQCPAYRGIAYAVFEDLQLADFGNRIPSLTFEIFEREMPVALADIVTSASQGAIAGHSALTLAGYAVQGSDCRSALQPIAAAMPVLFAPAGDHLSMSDWSANAAETILDQSAVSDGKSALDRPGRSRGADSRAPASVSVRHYDPERDFQAGIQASRRIGSARGEAQIEFPAALDAATARWFAELQLLQRSRGLNGFAAALPLGIEPIAVGNQLSAAESGNVLRIVEVEHMRGTTRVVATEWLDQFGGSLAADPGRSQPGLDLLAGSTRLIVADLPAFGTDDPGRPTLVVAAAGTEPGWRRAALSLGEGGQYLDLGATNGVATMGTLLTALPPHTALLEDRFNQPVVRLLHETMTLPTGSGDPSAFAAPSLRIDGEIIRYGHAEKIGARDYRLSGLLRGCHGTGDGNPSHAIDAEALLLEPSTLFSIDSVPTPVGAVLEIEALGLSDTEPVESAITVSGLAVTPRRPVHGNAESLANGDALLSWVRRDRLAHLWSDGVDVPNSESATEFWVELHTGTLKLAVWSVSTSSLQIGSAELAALSIPSGSTLDFSIVQQGRFARSPALVVQIIR